MKKGIFILTLLILALFSVSCIYAADADDALASNEDTAAIEIAQIDDIIVSDEIQAVEQSNDEELILEDNDVKELGAGEYNYTDLRNQIGTGGDINLVKGNYYYVDGDGDTIEISTSGVIDGNGAVIDMAGSAIRAFKVNTSGVTIKNMTIKNANYAGIGGAIYFSGEGIVTDCNFVNDSAYAGGALSFGQSGTVKNCNFTDNKATSRDILVVPAVGGAIYFDLTGTVENCNFTNNNATYYGGAVYSLNQCNVTNCNFTSNTANLGGAVCFDETGNVSNCNFAGNTATDSGGAVYSWNQCNVTNCNFTNNNASNLGGAIVIYSASVENCNFTNNQATGDDSEGGAIYFHSSGTVSNCNFEDNNVSGNGGAVSFAHDKGSVENCNFTNNSASMGGAVYFSSPDSVAKRCDFAGNNAIGDGGAVYFASGECSAENCNFTSNSALKGGAVYFKTSGYAINCSFASNNVSGDGGAVYAGNEGIIMGCNFTDNSASGDGGAARIYDGLLMGCNFTGNTAVGDGGAVFFDAWGSVGVSSFACNTGRSGGALWVLNAQIMACNFEKNNASENGGAVFFDSGDLEECNFTANTASNHGGAICFDAYANPTNCSFAGNTALMGGAAYFSRGAAVHYCNFTGNIASNGSALYFEYTPENNFVHDSTFLENTADAQAIDIIKNDDNITIIFTGNDNLLNAIYSSADIRFTNVTYLGADGIVANTGTSSPARANREAGQNITVAIIVDDRIILDDVKITDAEGTVILYQSIAGNYVIIARHDENSYYTKAERIVTNVEHYINVTSIEANNRTVNLTAKSNIYGEVMSEVPQFIISNGNSVAAVYAGNGTWWAIYTFDDYSAYNVSAFYAALENVSVGNATIVITRADSTLIVDNVVMEYGDSLNLSVTAEGATGITARIDGEDVGVSGFSIMISGLNVGTHTLEVMTVPDEDHNSVRKTANITVSKLKTELVADSITVIYNMGGDLAITLKDVRGNPLANQILLVDFNGEKIYDFTDSNGTIKVPLKGLAANTYAARIVFMGNDDYNGSDANATVTVKKDGTSLSAGAVTAVYNVNKNLVITLKDSRGNPIKGASVTVDLNGARTYSTDAKGQIKVAVGSLVPKVYTAKIAFKGNGNYLKSTKDVKVTVKKATPKLAAKNKKFKKSKKVKKYTVTLKSNVGKAMKKVKVTLKVKGKKAITVKTNNKGKATFKIKKLTKKGKYKATVTYKGNKNYNKVTKKVKITIK